MFVFYRILKAIHIALYLGEIDRGLVSLRTNPTLLDKGDVYSQDDNLKVMHGM